MPIATCTTCGKLTDFSRNEAVDEPLRECSDCLFESQWRHVMGGLDRAVAWLQSHKINLKHGFTLQLNRTTGIEIHIGMTWIGNPDEDRINHLFAGKRVELTKTATEDRYRFVDAELGLTFSWSIYHPSPEEPQPVKTIVELPSEPAATSASGGVEGSNA